MTGSSEREGSMGRFMSNCSCPLKHQTDTYLDMKGKVGKKVGRDG